MILLDTDHISVLRYTEHPRCTQLRARLETSGDPMIGMPIIVYEEQVRGWFAAIHRQKDVSHQVAIYERLRQVIDFTREWQIIMFDARAASEFKRLRALQTRIGTQDLKIASTALVHNALLLTGNTRDFDHVPGLRHENWLG